MPNGKMQDCWLKEGCSPYIIQTYVLREGILHQILPVPVFGDILFSMVTGLIRSWLTHKMGIGFKSSFVFEVGESTRFQWKDGRNFFGASTGSLPLMMLQRRSCHPVGIDKWSIEIRAVPDDFIIWGNVWKLFREDQKG